MQKKAIAKQLLIALKAIHEAQMLVNELDVEDYASVVELQNHYKAIKKLLNDKFDKNS